MADSTAEWGCKPKPPKIPSGLVTPYSKSKSATITSRSTALPVPWNVYSERPYGYAPSHGRYLLDQEHDYRTQVRLVLGEQSRQDGGVVIDDRVGAQPGLRHSSPGCCAFGNFSLAFSPKRRMGRMPRGKSRYNKSRTTPTTRLGTQTRALERVLTHAPKTQQKL